MIDILRITYWRSSWSVRREIVWIDSFSFRKLFSMPTMLLEPLQCGYWLDRIKVNLRGPRESQRASICSMMCTDAVSRCWRIAHREVHRTCYTRSVRLTLSSKCMERLRPSACVKDILNSRKRQPSFRTKL